MVLTGDHDGSYSSKEFVCFVCVYVVARMCLLTTQTYCLRASVSQESRQVTLALSSWPYQTEIKKLFDARISRDI